MPETTPKTILLNVDNNQGYAPDQVGSTLTLRELLDAVEEAIEQFGEDAQVVTEESGNRYGARFGRLANPYYGDLFTDPAAEDDDEG